MYNMVFTWYSLSYYHVKIYIRFTCVYSGCYIFHFRMYLYFYIFEKALDFYTVHMHFMHACMWYRFAMTSLASLIIGYLLTCGAFVVCARTVSSFKCCVCDVTVGSMIR